MSKFSTYTIKWRSQRYPELVLYEEEYMEMKEMFTYIKSFRDEMLNLEKWLFANPERMPKSERGWVKQVRNWMRLADRFAEQKYLDALVRGNLKSTKMSVAEAGLRLSQIMKRSQAEEARVKKSEAKKEADPVPFGDALNTIASNMSPK